MCTSPCPGDSSETCGGPDIHSIWYAPPGTFTAVQNVTGPDASGYLGCYSIDHSTEDNLILHHTLAFDSANMTNEFCLQSCADHGATWSATTNAHTCHCGTEYVLGDGFYVSDSTCSWSCSGDSTEKCGAYQTEFSVYNVTLSGTMATNATEYPDGRNGSCKV